VPGVGLITGVNGVMKRNEGFTLIEILVVVIILGILAATVIPQFSNAGDSARATTTHALLRTVRSQLQTYKLQHHAQFPLLEDMWDAMVKKTDGDGLVDPTGAFGPYLTKVPINQYTQSFTVVAAGAGTANDGFEYDEDEGAITAVGFDEDTNIYTAP